MHLILQVFAARSSSPLFDSSIDRSSVKFTRSLQPAVEGGIFQPMFRCRAAGEIINRSGQNGINPIRLSVAQAATRAGVHLNPAGNNTENGSGDHARRNSAPVLSARPAGDIALFKASRPSRRHGSCITKSAPIGKPPA